MRISGLIWMEDIIEKLERKHAVRQQEVREVMENGPSFRFMERGYRQGEDVYAAFGQTDAGRYLVAFFVHKASGQALIVSAREMTQAERRLHEKSKK